MVLRRQAAPYSIDAIFIDAICVGALCCGDRTLPSDMPTKNITASKTAITPSFVGGVSLRICLFKSSWSYWFIFAVPIFVHRKRYKRSAVSLTGRGTNIGFLSYTLLNDGIDHQFKKISVGQCGVAGSRGLPVA
jgi:hypothetical protein